ncbi:MAG: hypothetical protein WCK26_03125 [Candidatus Saccharibacteria bacterium]
MEHQIHKLENDDLSFREKHSFSLFIVFSIFISSIIVVASMFMYSGSGAAQLDLSRPGYVSVRSQSVVNVDDFKNFPSLGPMNQNVINEFKSSYEKQSQKVKSANAFGGDSLNLDELGLTVILTE